MLDAKLSDAIRNAVDGDAPALEKLALDIHANPELRFEEHKAAKWIADLASSRGHAVERNVAGLSTALLAKAGKKGGSRIAILAEYDALPEIGHACGHNLKSAARSCFSERPRRRGGAEK